MNNKQQIIIEDFTFETYISAKEIEEIVSSIANRINEDYISKKPVFIIVLKGAMFFAIDLLKKIALECEIDTLSAKSYHGGIISSGKVQLDYFPLDIENKDVILIEDIVDTGLTLTKIKQELSLLKPNSIEFASLLVKPSKLIDNFNVKYIGRNITDEFVIGYGLDLSEKYRNLNEIYIRVDK